MEVESTSTPLPLQPADKADEGATVQRDQFLKLLVAQMKYQDPMNPMEGTEFTAQLAQFSSLEQLFQVNENLEAVQTAQAEQAHLQMTGYIGKHVVTEGTGIAVTEGVAGGAKYDLLASGARGELAVYDGTGSLVRRIELGPREPGTYDVQWDARDMDLNPVPDGTYRFQVNFYDQDDGYIPAQTYQTSRVQGLVFENGRTLLDLGHSRVPVQEVVQVVSPPVVKAEATPED